MTEIWMQTFLGRKFYFGRQDNDPHLIDIARSLSRQNRYYGHSSSPVSVAEHSLVVVDIVAAEGGSVYEQLLALLHDAHEAYVGDIIRPLAEFLKERYGISLRGLKQDIQRQIYTSLGIRQPEPPELHRIDKADLWAMTAERRLFLPSSNVWHIDGLTIPDYVMGSYSNLEADAACRLFEKAYERLKASVDLEARLAATEAGAAESPAAQN